MFPGSAAIELGMRAQHVIAMLPRSTAMKWGKGDGIYQEIIQSEEVSILYHPQRNYSVIG
jgi:hypothetical protein